MGSQQDKFVSWLGKLSSTMGLRSSGSLDLFGLMVEKKGLFYGLQVFQRKCLFTSASAVECELSVKVPSGFLR